MNVTQRRQQFAMNPVETAIAHHQNLVARTSVCADPVKQSIEIVADHGFFTHRGQYLASIPAEMGGVAVGPVGFDQAVRQLRFHHAELHGVRTWFEDGQNARSRADLAP